jgi:hypothetical protein
LTRSSALAAVASASSAFGSASMRASSADKLVVDVDRVEPLAQRVQLVAAGDGLQALAQDGQLVAAGEAVEALAQAASSAAEATRRDIASMRACSAASWVCASPTSDWTSSRTRPPRHRGRPARSCAAICARSSASSSAARREADSWRSTASRSSASSRAAESSSWRLSSAAAQLGGGGALALDHGAQLGELGGLGAFLAQRVDAGAQRLGLARQLLEPAAVVAGQALGGVALDGDGGQLLADRVGLALHALDALQRAGQLGPGGLALALAVALQPLDRLAQLVLGGLDGLLVLGAHVLELRAHARARRCARRARPAAATPARGGRRRPGSRCASSWSRRAASWPDGLGGGERAAALGVGLVAVHAGALEPVDAGEQLEVDRGRAQLGAQRLGVALGLSGARLGVAAGLLELRGQPVGDALELVDALERAEQARDDRGGVVEVGDRALDARVALVRRSSASASAAARSASRRASSCSTHGVACSGEDDERAGGAPALPRLCLGLDRGLQRANDDRVRWTHPHQHQVHRQLERQVLEEEREVESLVELDRDEDRLHRELGAVAPRRPVSVTMPGRAAARRCRGTRARPAGGAAACRRSASRRSSG